VHRNSTLLLAIRSDAARSALVEALGEQHGYKVLMARSAAEARAIVEDAHIDLMMIDDGPGFEGCELLGRLRVSNPDVVRVLVLAETSERAHEASSKAFVYQYLRRPLDVEQAALVVKRGLEGRELARRHRLLSREFKISDDSSLLALGQTHPLHPQSQRFEKLVYASDKMSELCEGARTAARTELPILIQGETGTGKELLARAIHYSSARHASPLLVQNCGGMPDELLQSELFGHKRGAFTGAISDRLGLFRAADGGTVFLDEISEVSPSFQVSLLRFLQEGELKPLGSDATLTADVRIIAACNRPLKPLVESGEFRRDLYYRLKGFELEVPPLRARPQDIPALAEFFAAKHSEAMSRKILGISASALDKLMGYEFPGNVRELETEIRRMVAVTNDGEYIGSRSLSQAILDAAPRTPRQGLDCAADGRTLKAKVESLEKSLVSEALARLRWNQSKAAEELGLSRVGLANKIKRYGLDRAAR
jgi:two-component system, NtrC family, response regulator HupR/HoxA